MDKVGETTVAEGVSGGAGGEEGTSALLVLTFWALALSCANTSQNALCVMKLSLLQQHNTHYY